MNRRRFLAISATAAAATSLIPRSATDTGNRSNSGLRILILGGTGFLGPACTESALARGHHVTHFNSGRTEQRRRQAGRESVVPAGVKTLYGNRDPEKTADDRRKEGKTDAPRDPTSPRGLTQLEGKKWDAVIDTSGYFPRMVTASAKLLAPNVKQYVFISSISVYQTTSVPGFDESAPVRTLQDPTTEEMGPGYANFGGGKALCEKAAESALPGRVTNVRPGYIIGPRDTSARFIYWPVRVSLGGNMLVPGGPEDPIQVIDVRDLSDWIVRCIENRVVGVFNATGPEKPLSMRSMLEQVLSGVGTKTQFTWVDLPFLKSEKIELGRFPLYAPPVGETAGLHRCNISRALAKGLNFRPLTDTARVTMDWYKSLPEETRQSFAPQFVARPGQPSWLEFEAKLLAAWHAKNQKPKED